MRRSVPWRLSMKGEATAIRTRGIRSARPLRADLHELAPTLQHEQIPDARPSDRALGPLVTIPQAIHSGGLEDSGAAKALRRERVFQHAAQIVREPALKWEREGAFSPPRQIRQKSGRHEASGRVQQQTLLLHAHTRRNRKKKFHHAMIEEHRTHLNAVRHAHGIEVAQQAWLEVSV